MAEPSPSAVDALQRAIEHTRRHLFPFRFDRWLVLGCVAFLDQCGRRGGTTGFNVPSPGGWGGGGGGPDQGDFTRVMEWLGAHVVLVAGAAAAVLALMVALTALVLWLNSRGVFMYIDDVATGRADFERPWREHAGRAASYFVWSFGLALATLVGFLVLLAFGVLAGVALWRAPSGAWLIPGLGLAATVAAFLGLILASSLASVALRDFVAPLQMRTDVGCGAAIRLFLALVRAHPAAFVVYVLLKIVFAMVSGIALLLAGCLTCCCALLPVIMQTALQPLFYFERAWPLFLLRQLGYDLVREYETTA